MKQRVKSLRTRIYVDGYNLYYGSLKGTSQKWLDLKVLFSLILPTVLHEIEEQPVQFNLQPLSIRYFTAPILSKFARAPDSVKCQSDYHAALRGHLGDAISIIEGRYDARIARAHEFIKGQPAKDSTLLEIWKLEEKQSDVALALHAFSDALLDEVDQVVFVTNDTDLVPAMEMIRKHTKVTIGLIVPTKEKTRRANTSLTKLSHWTRSKIKDDELEMAQLPTSIRGLSRVIHKPISWYPRPDLLGPIFEEAKRVRRSTGSAWKWLNEPSQYLDGRIPIDMTECEDQVAELWVYMKKYTEDFEK